MDRLHGMGRLKVGLYGWIGLHGMGRLKVGLYGMGRLTVGLIG